MSSEVYNVLTWGLLGTGIVLGAANAVWWISLTFSEGVLWGLLCLFIPFANLFFVAMHWKKARDSFLLGLASVSLIYGAIITSNQTQGSSVLFIHRFRNPGSLSFESAAKENPPAVDLAQKVSGVRLKLAGTGHRTGSWTAKSSGAAEAPVRREPAGLLEAVHAGDMGSFNALLRQGTGLNDRTRITGSTVLMESAALGHREMVQKLLDAGADTSLTNSEGKTAHDIAVENGREEIAAMIEKHKQVSAS